METIEQLEKEIKERQLELAQFGFKDEEPLLNILPELTPDTEGERRLVCWGENILFKAKLQQSEDFVKMIDEIKNPYPEDIFPEIHEELFEEIIQELINKFEFPLDRLSASLMRKARENLIEELKKEVRNSSQD